MLSSAEAAGEGTQAPPGGALQREHMLNPDDAAMLILNVRQLA